MAREDIEWEHTTINNETFTNREDNFITGPKLIYIRNVTYLMKIWYKLDDKDVKPSKKKHYE